MTCVVLIEHGFCGLCYARKRGRNRGHGKVPTIPEVVFCPFTEADMGMRRTEQTAAGAGGAKLTDEVFQGFYPTLFEWMTETQWEDGKARKTSTLLLFVENGRWKAHLNDRDNRRGFWASAESQEWLLESVEKTLLDGSAEWKKDTR